MLFHILISTIMKNVFKNMFCVVSVIITFKVFSNINTESRTELPPQNIPSSRTYLDFFDHVDLTDDKVLNYTPDDLIDNGHHIKYIPGLKNPCFIVKGETSIEDRFYCLPYFFLAGTEKCGSSDLALALIKHHNIHRPSINTEVHWFDRIHQKEEINLRQYSLRFNGTDKSRPCNGSAVILQCIKTAKSLSSCLDIIGDYTPKYISHGVRWQLTKQNANLREPKYLIHHKIYRMNSRSKIIFIFRDPTERLCSSYNYFMDEQYERQNITNRAYDFHQRVVGQINTWNACILILPLRTCMYGNPEGFIPPGLFFWDQKHMDQIRAGLYYYFVMEWLKVFTTDQILILNLHDYSRNRLNIIQEKILPFLGLSNYWNTEQTWFSEIQRNSRIINSRKKTFKMLDETRLMINKFYEPYNDKMSHLLLNWK